MADAIETGGGRPGHLHSEYSLSDDGTRQSPTRTRSGSLVSTPSEDSNLDVLPESVQGHSTEGDAFITEEPENNTLGSSTQQQHEMSRSKSVAHKNDSSKKLEHHTLSLWLASAFAIASIFIWAITCTLSYKPIQFETYFDTAGRFSRDQFEQNDRWRRVSRVGLQALGTLSIPVTSAICTRAVVVYCQRSSKKRQPAITMRQTLTLADKGWLDLHTWMNLLGPKAGKVYSPLLLLSMLLCGVAFMISILQGAFVDTVSITVMTDADTNKHNLWFGSNTGPVAYSTVGTTLSILNGNKELYLPSVIEATIAGKAGDLQPNLWIIGQNSSNLTSMDSFYSSTGRFPDVQPEGYSVPLQQPQTVFHAKPFFTSSLPVGTDTGILKALALRMSTSLQCQELTHAEFPSDCNETASLAMNFTNTQFQARADEYLSNTYYIAPIFLFHICSPRAQNWTRDNDSSHSLREELYMDLQTWPSSATDKIWGAASNVPIRYNFTYHCTADTNLGYFEPGNEWNRHQVQDNVDITNTTNAPHFTGLNTRSDTHGLIYSPTAPGPLATSIRALFVNNTFFNSIINANDTRGANLDVCHALRMPLTGLCSQRGSDKLMCNPYISQSGSTLRCIRPSDSNSQSTTEDNYPEDYGLANATASDGTLAYFLYMWLQRFNDWNSTMAALTATNFYATRALLDPSRARDLDFSSFDSETTMYKSDSDNDKSKMVPYALPIYSSPGLQIQKLHAPFLALVIIGVLIAAQVAGLLALGVYSTRRTWTVSLDGFAMLRIGQAMRREEDTLPLISAAEAKEAAVLDRVEGWVGAEDADPDEKSSSGRGAGDGGARFLVLGGKGDVVSKARYHLYDHRT
ncbi:MAG: hypothetical protein Q9168_007273 [Polycauliona sp. 1 TL-2023]